MRFYFWKNMATGEANIIIRTKNQNKEVLVKGGIRDEYLSQLRQKIKAIEAQIPPSQVQKKIDLLDEEIDGRSVASQTLDQAKRRMQLLGELMEERNEPLFQEALMLKKRHNALRHRHTLKDKAAVNDFMAFAAEKGSPAVVKTFL